MTPATEPAIAPLTGAPAIDNSPQPPEKSWLKCRVLLVLIVLSVIPASLSMAIIFLGSDGHYPLDVFPRNENGVGFLA